MPNTFFPLPIYLISNMFSSVTIRNVYFFLAHKTSCLFSLSDYSTTLPAYLLSTPLFYLPEALLSYVALPYNGHGTVNGRGHSAYSLSCTCFAILYHIYTILPHSSARYAYTRWSSTALWSLDRYRQIQPTSLTKQLPESHYTPTATWTGIVFYPVRACLQATSIIFSESLIYPSDASPES